MVRPPRTSTHWSRRCGPPVWRRTEASSPSAVSAPDLAAEHGTPAYVLDEADFRRRAAAFRARSPVRRLLRRQGVPLPRRGALGRRGGDGPRRLHGRRAGLALARIPARPDRVPRQQQVGRRAAARSRPASGDRRRLAEEIDRLARARRGAWRPGNGPDPGHRRRRGAHPRVRRDRPRGPAFGFSIAGGDAFEAVAACWPRPALRLVGLHSHIGSQIFDTYGFEVAARRCSLHAVLATSSASTSPTRSRRWLRHRVHDRRTIPLTPDDLPPRPARDRRRRVPRRRHRRAAAVGRAGARDRRPATFTLYEVGTIKDSP